jgi:hypothetical protein
MKIQTNTPNLPAAPKAQPASTSVKSSGDSFHFSSMHNNKALKYGAIAAVGAVIGGAALNHFTSGLSGAAAHVAGGVAGALAGGAGLGLVAGIIGGKTQEGFGGLAAAEGYAAVGAGVGLIGGAIAGAHLGVSSGNVPVMLAGGLAGGAAALVFANGLKHH